MAARRPPRPAVAVLALLLASAPGCAATLRGLVSAEDRGGATLRTPEGGTWRLRLGEGSWPLRSLDGCTVQVEGRRVLGSVVAQGWQVLDAGDGSVPYVGRVQRLGSNLVIEDRFSGMALVIEEPAGGLAARLEGRLAMVSGYIVGPQILRMVGYRVLQEWPDRARHAGRPGPEEE